MSATEFQANLLNMRSRMYGLAYKFTANKEDAEDLFQETILNALKYRHTFRELNNFSAWVLTIMRNCFINNYKRSQRKKKLIQNEELGSLQRINLSDNIQPDSRIQLNDIHQLIDALSPVERKTLVMHLEGYKYVEIAGELNIPAGTVKSRLFNAKKKLAQTISSNS